MDIQSALMFILPQANYHFDGEKTYENLIWDDLFFTKPTLEELQTAEKYALLSQLSETNDYRIERSKHYPTAEQQLQMIFDLGVDGWRERIQNVKNNIPKPD